MKFISRGLPDRCGCLHLTLLALFTLFTQCKSYQISSVLPPSLMYFLFRREVRLKLVTERIVNSRRSKRKKIKKKPKPDAKTIQTFCSGNFQTGPHSLLLERESFHYPRRMENKQTSANPRHHSHSVESLNPL